MLATEERMVLSALWDALIAGSTKVLRWSYTDESWLLTVASRPRDERPVHALRRRDVAILENTLLSGIRKHAALEAGLSCSSIAVIMQSCFEFMGLSCLPSRIPGVVVAAAHARHHLAYSGTEPASSARPFLVGEQTITLRRPDTQLAAWLAPAEHAVIHQLIEGMTYAEIALARRTSVRTVANQVASGFRRLEVSGRAELLCLLARWALNPPTPPRKRPSSLVPSGAKLRARRPRLRHGRGGRPSTHSPSPAI